MLAKLPEAVATWAPPGIVVAFAGLFLRFRKQGDDRTAGAEQRAEARAVRLATETGDLIDELREEIKRYIAEAAGLRTEISALTTQVRALQHELANRDLLLLRHGLKLPVEGHNAQVDHVLEQLRDDQKEHP